MDPNPVKSSDLKSVGYDEASNILEVEFLDKSIYQYSRVPVDVYENLMNAVSKGKYFAKFIKNNRFYCCRQVFPIQRFVG